MNNQQHNILTDNNLYQQPNKTKRLLAEVVIPVKCYIKISYLIPKDLETSTSIGSWILVNFSGKYYNGVVKEIYAAELTGSKGQKSVSYKEFEQLLPREKVSSKEIIFWEQISGYYMCTMGETFKAAYTENSVKQDNVKRKKTPESYALELKDAPAPTKNELSGVQQTAYSQILSKIDEKPVLLNGVTGSGKTEIYINLAIEAMEQGKQVLFMVPEISLSRQLQTRLKKIFGKHIVTYHSQQTPANKQFVRQVLSFGQTDGTDTNSSNLPVIVLGTRSSLFLPFRNLGLIIVDEEHDLSYKQTEPNPRYNGRDAALLLARIHGARIILGSATPSLETFYNVSTNKFAQVLLDKTYYGAIPPQITVIDTLKARKTRQMNGSFSQQLINIIRKELSNNGQILIFRNRRSYSPQIECFDCGHSPLCPHCNVHLSYHKSQDRLYCHHCEYTVKFSHKCQSCGSSNFIFRGVGTEKLEEELTSLFPDKKIARYDADTAKSIKFQQETLKKFAAGEINILVGTQMVSKGFDFPHLSLVVVMQAETMIGMEDFRADERAIQLLKQVMGRAGRRSQQGKLVIQTSCVDHPVFTTLVKELRTPAETSENCYREYLMQLLAERREYGFAPFVRMVKIIVRHSNVEKLGELCNIIKSKVQENSGNIQYMEMTGPFAPAIDKIRGEFIRCFYIKFQRNNHLPNGKRALNNVLSQIRKSGVIIADVDPM